MTAPVTTPCPEGHLCCQDPDIHHAHFLTPFYCPACQRVRRDAS